jgi:hypothetical protein
LGNVKWNDADLTGINWRYVRRLGDEKTARFRDLDSLRSVVKTYHTLAELLRMQGLSEAADYFSYREKVRQRLVLLRQSDIYAATGSLLLDLLAGYGFKPMRTLAWYVGIVFGYAAAYSSLGTVNGHSFNAIEALVFSVTSFHGRGFFPGMLPLDNVVIVLAATEAVIGLLIEIVFIATFTQRFFAH